MSWVLGLVVLGFVIACLTMTMCDPREKKDGQPYDLLGNQNE